ncbi:hypothetical protein ENBRE01_1756 [Enteropsectra breve]|nr:hypothetical protein ENBRE01_1756 [Enteropsectra breve]
MLGVLKPLELLCVMAKVVLAAVEEAVPVANPMTGVKSKEYVSVDTAVKFILASKSFKSKLKSECDKMLTIPTFEGNRNHKKQYIVGPVLCYYIVKASNDIGFKEGHFSDNLEECYTNIMEAAHFRSDGTWVKRLLPVRITLILDSLVFRDDEKLFIVRHTFGYRNKNTEKYISKKRVTYNMIRSETDYEEIDDTNISRMLSDTFTNNRRLNETFDDYRLL